LIPRKTGRLSVGRNIRQTDWYEIRGWKLKKRYIKTIQILAHADDVVLEGLTIGVLAEAIINLCKVANNIMLTLNLQKTKYVETKKGI
jgi:hypothetical protein